MTCSVSSKNLRLTETRASAGHSWNQSIAVQLVTAGNFLPLTRSVVPTGEKHNTTFSCRRTRSMKNFQQFSLVSCRPAPKHENSRDNTYLLFVVSIAVYSSVSVILICNALKQLNLFKITLRVSKPILIIINNHTKLILLHILIKCNYSDNYTMMEYYYEILCIKDIILL